MIQARETIVYSRNDRVQSVAHLRAAVHGLGLRLVWGRESTGHLIKGVSYVQDVSGQGRPWGVGLCGGGGEGAC